MKDKLLDIFLLPKTMYQKINDKKATLYAGILFVGAVDIIFPLVVRYLSVFKGKSQTALNYNVGLMLLFAVVLGLVDVMFFTLPMFDFLKFIKRGAVESLNYNKIRLAKVYVAAHIVVLPFNIIFMVLLYNPTGAMLSEGMQVMALIYSFFIMPAWFTGIIARGVNVIFKMEQRFKPLVFAALFTWNYLLGSYALDYVINNWVMYFFK